MKHDSLSFTREIPTENYDKLEVECEVSSYNGDIDITINAAESGVSSLRIGMSRDEFNAVVDAVRSFDLMRSNLSQMRA